MQYAQKKVLVRERHKTKAAVKSYPTVYTTLK